FAAYHWARTGNAVLHANWAAAASWSVGVAARHVFDGACLGMLGATGIETPANFVQELRPGAIPKTMRNLWWLLAAINMPLMLLATAVLPLETMRRRPVSALAALAAEVGGAWLRVWVVADAAIVMCAVILTANVGVLGLAERMAEDRVLP